MKKITQVELAKQVGVSQSYISGILRGRTPSCRVAERLEGVTGIHRLHWLYPKQYDEKGIRACVAKTPTEPEEVNHELA